MPANDRSQRLLFNYGICIAFATLLILNGVLASPSEAANAILFGFSAPRLVMAVGLFSVLGIFASLAIKATTNQKWAKQFVDRWFGRNNVSVKIGWFSGVGSGLGWIGYHIPIYRAGPLENYWARIQPMLLLFLIASMATWVLYIVIRNNLTIQSANLLQLKVGLPIFIPCLILLGWMFFSGFGVTTTGSLEDFWYGAGVPILASQLIMVLMGAILFLWFGSSWQSMRSDILICILIYAVTAYMWASEPLKQSFMFTGPMQPNGEFYPFADAASFDLASQFSLIGENFHTLGSPFFERPLYLSLLVFLHLLAGQNYETLMVYQAGLFALLPVLIYLIGRSLDMRSVGFGAALVATFRGINSIAASTWIDMANPKMILTDFPTAIGIALVVLFLCDWLKAPAQKRHYLAWIGGTVGFTLMLRTNALILLVFILFYLFLKFIREPKSWLITSSLIVVSAIAITLPWEIRNWSLGGQIYGPIVTKFQNVIKQRYPSLFQHKTSLFQEQGLDVVTIKTIRPILTVTRQWDAKTAQYEKNCESVVCFSSKHFLHNMLTSLLILPTSPILDDLRYLVKDRHPDYWDADWDGKFTGTAPFFLAVNLFLVTTGIAVAWKQTQAVGLAPLAIFIVYNISNALARTSGGRYVVPVDWILPTYYVLGVIYIAIWLADTVGIQWKKNSEIPGQPSQRPQQENQLAKNIFVLMVLFGFGWIIPFSEKLYVPRYQNIDPLITLEANRTLIENSGLKLDELKIFMQSPDARLIVGRVLYPRFYKMNQGVLFHSQIYPSNVMGFPRIAFKLINSTGDYSVILPGDVPPLFPHASDTLVLGCNGPDYLDAILVVVLDERKVLLQREPTSELHCPLQQPVCDNNSNCQ